MPQLFSTLPRLDDSAAGQSKAASAPSAQSHYIWDLTFDPAGRLYIATGNPGAVYRVDPAKPDATPELFFKSDEAHIRTLAWDLKGNLIAGSDGSGLVYRIDPHGKGYVLFEAPRREITAIAIGANGTIYAACVGDKSHNPLPPLPVQGTATVTITVVQPGSLQAANASASVPEGTEIYALAEGKAPRKLWSGKDEIVYALAARADGLLALSGNRGRIFRIQDDGSYADIGHLQAQQGLSLACTESRRALSHRHGQHRQSLSAGRNRNARIRQRRSRCRSLCPLWPRRDRTRLLRLRDPHPLRQCRAARARLERLAAPAGRLRRLACGTLSAVEGRAARRRRPGQRRRQLSARELRACG